MLKWNTACIVGWIKLQCNIKLQIMDVLQKHQVQQSCDLRKQKYLAIWTCLTACWCGQRYWKMQCRITNYCIGHLVFINFWTTPWTYSGIQHLQFIWTSHESLAHFVNSNMSTMEMSLLFYPIQMTESMYIQTSLVEAAVSVLLCMLVIISYLATWI